MFTSPGDRAGRSLIIRQIVSTSTSGVATGTTTIPGDDTIPQNTEGTEFLTLSITPKSAASTLYIDANLMLSPSVAVGVVVALFQDSITNALATVLSYVSTNNAFITIPLQYKTAVIATTSPTTFKIRAGPYSAATLTINGQGGSRLFGGVAMSTLRIIEAA